ncbi:MAG: YggS family pyridoxal phosphate-dependent enzyme [Acidimicrobiales bacterium]|nr:YggS family pyridoxal phosphate-dependent enzyme [Acidimicrobiales bacterium]
MAGRGIVTSETYSEEIKERLEEINKIIDAKAQNPVTLIGVTKGFTHEEVNIASELGIKNFGENYAQELLTKNPLVDPEISWHYIGQLQSNKIRKISHLVDVWHSVTSLKLAREIHKRNDQAQILLQVSLMGPSNSKGFEVEQLPQLISELRDMNIDISGLMTMGVPGDMVATRVVFKELRKLADTFELPECSMGMSDDFEIALESGASMIRVGSAIFGNRRPD